MKKKTNLTNISSNSGLATSSNNLTKWQDFYFKLENQLMTEDLIKQSLLLLYKKISSDLYNYRDYFILIQFKIKINNSYRSISYLQTIKFEEFFDLEDIFLEF
jgi:hypothetical protein